MPGPPRFRAGDCTGGRVRLSGVYSTSGLTATPRTTEISACFGLSRQPDSTTILRPFEINLLPGRIVLITGPSGSGKSTALMQMKRRLPGAVLVQRQCFPPRRAVIDGLANSASTADAIAVLTACGLAEAPLWLKSFDELSAGEKFRARLARGLTRQGQDLPTAAMICDEFCSNLHRRCARAISYCLRKLVARRRLRLVVACANDDIVADLQPDTVVRLARGHAAIEHRAVRIGRPLSDRARMCITRGGKRDYEAFSAMHYRRTDELGFVSKVFVLRDRFNTEILGIVVYAHPPMELSLRNQATGGQFVRNPRLLNRRVRILRRLVIHPDLRGCGLGHYLVRRTLPLVGTDFVECLASMGAFHPVFEKAGMARIGQCEIPDRTQTALRRLEDLGVDPRGRDFPLRVARSSRVRELVLEVVRNWYRATTAEGGARVARQSFEFLAQAFRGIIGSRPVYYLWKRRPKRAHLKPRTCLLARRPAPVGGNPRNRPDAGARSIRLPPSGATSCSFEVLERSPGASETPAISSPSGGAGLSSRHGKRRSALSVPLESLPDQKDRMNPTAPLREEAKQDRRSESQARAHRLDPRKRAVTSRRARRRPPARR